MTLPSLPVTNLVGKRTVPEDLNARWQAVSLGEVSQASLVEGDFPQRTHAGELGI